MNKELKQSLIKIAIIFGVMLLSAFFTFVNADNFEPTNGDVTASTNREYSVPDYYTYADYITLDFLCCNHGSPDGTSQLRDENGYHYGNGVNGFEETEETKNAQKNKDGLSSLADFAFQITDSLKVDKVENSDKIYWGPPTPINYVGTTKIKLTYLRPYSIMYDIDRVDPTFAGTTFINVEWDLEPFWHQAGGLGSEQLKKKIVNKDSFLKTEIKITAYQSSTGAIVGNDDKMTYAEVGMGNMWDKIISYSKANPVYTTTLGSARKVDNHEHANISVDEVVFDYIYAEVEDSSEGEPQTPAQYANWMALGQTPVDPATDTEITDEEVRAKQLSNYRLGSAMFKEATSYAEYAKKMEEISGPIQERFIDVMENDQVVPVEVSVDSNGDMIVGPFAVEYTEWALQGGRGLAQFAGIYDAMVVTNDTEFDESKMEDKGLAESEYEIFYKNQKRETSNLVNPQYPHSGETFFIKIKKKEGRTEFRSIDFKFRYLTVEGGAIEITEDLYYYKWYVDVVDGDYSIVGELYAGHKNGHEYGEQQNQAINIKGSRKYVYTKLHYGMRPLKLSITKRVVNESDNNNNQLAGQAFTLNKVYKFKITLHNTADDVRDNKNPTETFYMNLKADDTKIITKYIADDVAIPYFRVEEIDRGGADSVEFDYNMTDKNREDHTNSEGKLDFPEGIIYGRLYAKRAVTVKCTNKYKVESAKITLSKELSEPAVEDELYKLNVDIIEGADKLIGKSSAIKNSVELRVKKDETKAQVYVNGKPVAESVTFEYFWLNDKDNSKNNAPKYRISEEANDNYKVTFKVKGKTEEVENELVGQFEEQFNGHVEVTAVNHREHTFIRIAKESIPKLEEGDVKTYYFRIKVGTRYDIKESLVLRYDSIENGRNIVKGDIHEIILDNVKGDPYFIYEYDDETSMLGDKDGREVDKGTLEVYKRDEEAKYTKTAVNYQDNNFLDVNIKKSFKDGLVPEDDKVFTFKVTATQTNSETHEDKILKEFELKASKENNYVSSTERVEWEYGTPRPVITVEEVKDHPYVISNVRVLDEKGNDVTSSCTIDTSHIGSKTNDYFKVTNFPKNATLTFEVENTGEVSTKLTINKIVDGIDPNDDDEYAFEFIVDVDGERETLIASNKQVATKTITWVEGHEPTITIFEKKQDGYQLPKVVVNKEEINHSSYSDKDTDDLYCVYQFIASPATTDIGIDVTNKLDGHRGTVDIYKVLEEISGEKIEGRVFRFNLKQTLNGAIIDERNNVEIKSGDHYPYTATWVGDTAPKYEISEIKVDGVELKSISVEPQNIPGYSEPSDYSIDKDNYKVSGSFVDNKTIKVTYTNQEVREYTGKLVIKKKIVSTTGASIPNDFEATYSFNVEIKQGDVVKKTETVSIKVKGNQVVNSEIVKYSWKSNEETPTFIVTENDSNSLIAAFKDGIAVVNDQGKPSAKIEGDLAKDSTIECQYDNGIHVNKGKLSITKTVVDDKNNTIEDSFDEDFYFKVKIDGQDLPEVKIKSGETWTSGTYTWVGKADEGPAYEITEENPEHSKFVTFKVNGTKIDGKTVTGNLIDMELSDTPSVQVECINQADEHHAKASVNKIGITELAKNVTRKQFVEDYGGVGFIIDVSVIYEEGSFTVTYEDENGKDVVEECSPETGFKKRVSLDINNIDDTHSAEEAEKGKFKIKDIRWNGDASKGPKVIVHEVSCPHDGWSILNYYNNDVVLADGSNEEITVENQWGQTNLVMPMGGTVWYDTKKDEKNTENSEVNGIMDDKEVGIPNVEVTVKRYLVDSDDKIIADTGKARVYDLHGNTIEVFPLYTDETGRWDISYLELPGLTPYEKVQGAVSVKYGVEYTYDGYTYEPTIYLSNKTEFTNQPLSQANADAISRANGFYNSDVANRNGKLNRSFALDNTSSRTAFNNQFQIISGDTAIASDNSTSGYALGENNSRIELQYEGTKVSYTPEGTNKTHNSLVSKLVTTNKEGRTLKQYQVKAYTLFNNTNPVGKEVTDSGLAYPFDDNVNIALASRSINGITYVATDPYLRNVNLGLVLRKDADIKVHKDVHSAKLVVNQKMTDREFGALYQLVHGNNYNIEETYNSEIDTITYELGLYKSDYYYRAQAYATSDAISNGLRKFYKDIVGLGEDYEALMNLQAYITYSITIRNASPTMDYDVAISSIMDYSDSSLELVKADVKNYIKDGNTGIGNPNTIVARAPYSDKDGVQVSVRSNSTIIKDSSTSRSYTKTQMDISQNGGPVVLSNNQDVTIFATYRLKKYSEDYLNQYLVNGENNQDAIREQLNLINLDGIELGDKANIAELKTYSVYKSLTEGKVYAGRVDHNSAPNNIDIVNKNSKDYYEDDTYAAPTLTVKLDNGLSKNVTGTVWEDNEIVSEDKSKADGVSLGNGIKDDDEYVIENMNVELVEKIQIPTSSALDEYYEYDFTWPENYDIRNNTVTVDDSSKNTLKALTDFDATISSDSNGTYVFNNIPAGAYVVRFHYGDKNGDYGDKQVTFASGSRLLEKDVYKFEGGAEKMAAVVGDNRNDTDPKTADYDKDRLPAVYNGQDFKSAAYSLGLDVEWLENDNNSDIVSKAADSQARRLEVINNSRILVNSNTSVLASAESVDANHDKLFKDYSMFADTPKIKIDSPNVDKKAETINNVSFGIVERPESRLVLDKEIEEITLVDNTGKELIKVKYDIDYGRTDENGNPIVINQNKDGSYKLSNPSAALSINEEQSFGLEYLQSLSKIENKYGFLDGNDTPIGAQNFRYIVYDTSMATSLTLQTKYSIAALNLGQADRTTEVLHDMNSDEINAVAQILKANRFKNETRTYEGLSYGQYTVTSGKFKYNGNKTVDLDNRFSNIVGETYYSNEPNSDEMIVNTKVGQIIDYVDTGLTFEQRLNTSENSSWYSTADDYLYHNNVIDKSIFSVVDYNVLLGDAATSEKKSKIMDKDGAYFDTTAKHNIILSVNTNKEGSTNVSNPDLIKDLVPYVEDASYQDNKQASIGFINLYTEKSIDSEAEDLIFDNIAEVVNYSNVVGRRTTNTIAGNADPKGELNLGAFQGALAEIDSSATEIITFSQPYGVSDRTKFVAEITIGIFSALAIVAAGIIIVKKKVL